MNSPPPPLVKANLVHIGASVPALPDRKAGRLVPTAPRPGLHPRASAQADFLGRLAETWSIAAAARHVGKSRESASRLRDKPGAGSFAAALDSILAQPRSARKSTHELLWRRAFHGTLKPVMRGGRHVATRHSPDNDAVLRLYRQEMRRRRARRDLDGKSR